MLPPIAILYNPRAGKGAALRRAMALRDALEAQSADTTAIDLLQSSTQEIERVLARSHAAAVVGGDGTLNSQLNSLHNARVPVLHLGAGTENIFSKLFNAQQSPAAAARALIEGEHSDIDLGRCNGRLFALMASVGADARIAAEVQKRRDPHVTKVHYIQAIQHFTASPIPDRFSVSADDERIADRTKGVCVIANCRGYAARLDPCPNADPTDALLDAAVLPFDSYLGMATWAARARLRIPPPITRATSFEITSVGPPLACQIDGEPLPMDGSKARIRIDVVPRALRVIKPR